MTTTARTGVSQAANVNVAVADIGGPVSRLPCPQRSRPKQPSVKVSEGTRTPDRLDHNQELYQLSYAHQGRCGI
jgi:hypothetical protein